MVKVGHLCKHQGIFAPLPSLKLGKEDIFFKQSIEDK